MMIKEMPRSEGVAALDRLTRKMLGITAEQFIEEYDAGQHRGCGSSQLAMLIPFARAR